MCSGHINLSMVPERFFDYCVFTVIYEFMEISSREHLRLQPKVEHCIPSQHSVTRSGLGQAPLMTPPSYGGSGEKEQDQI